MIAFLSDEYVSGYFIVKYYCFLVAGFSYVALFFLFDLSVFYFDFDFGLELTVRKEVSNFDRLVFCRDVSAPVLAY